MGALVSVVAIIFGIGWTIMAYTITRNSPFPVVGVLFPLFGVLFILIGIVQLVYNIKNTVSARRMSIVDITDNQEEADPLNEAFGRPAMSRSNPSVVSSVEGRLKQLDTLKIQGTISEEEYRDQRKRILGNI